VSTLVQNLSAYTTYYFPRGRNYTRPVDLGLRMSVDSDACWRGAGHAVPDQVTLSSMSGELDGRAGQQAMCSEADIGGNFTSPIRLRHLRGGRLQASFNFGTLSPNTTCASCRRARFTTARRPYRHRPKFDERLTSLITVYQFYQVNVTSVV